MIEFVKKHEKLFEIVIGIIAIILIFIPLRNYLTDTKSYSSIISILDEKKSNVTNLLAGSTAASTLITLLPNDVGTPIAEKVADLSSVFLLILAVLYLEKYLLTIIGFVSSVLWGIGTGFMTAAVVKQSKSLKSFGLKIIISATVIFAVIPISAFITKSIDKTYNDSIQETINKAIDSSENAEISTEEETQTEDKNVWDTISNIFNEAVDAVTSSVTNSYEWAEKTLNNFVEATAIMLVTSCVIPLLTLVIVVWIAKIAMTSISLKLEERSKGKLTEITSN